MAERSQFWSTNGVGDGPSGGHPQQHWLEMFRDIFTSDRFASEGVIGGMSSQLACSGVSGASPSITVAAGGAFVYGYYYQNTSNLSLALTKPRVGTTGGRIVLRADWTLQTVRAIARQSADGTSTPPSLNQTAGSQYEIPLCTYTITTGGTITITDVRDYCHPTALMFRRLGGDAINWNVSGTTVYRPGGMMFVCGSTPVPFSSSADSALTPASFGVTFGGNPLVLPATYNGGSSTNRRCLFTIESVSPTQCQIRGRDTNNSSHSNTIDCWWLAMGPEA
ncbi:hypothetical protein SE17_01735 [Kouleothrix aurantiaca]|uniref:Uncharacterized protein n=1 Tax=Kouleothrix aurantiaca TaxID=186479 RepID=A0A0N8PT78_9CHLR|nr:hypothetical protein SE17_01735 [Kouleothrix aurantiaca]